MIPKLYYSCQLDCLVDQLTCELDTRSAPLDTQIILVPNGQLRQWLQIEIAKRKGIAMGLKIIQPEQLFPSSQSLLERTCSLYAAIGKSKEEALVHYLEGKKKRRLELTEELSSLFAKYEQNLPLLNGANDWQMHLFHEICLSPKFEITNPIICFGIDYLPPLYWRSLLTAPALSLYQFSPCIEFWEDICSDRERKSLNRYWRKKGAKQENRVLLDTYLRDRPKLLANWGKLGRLALKELDDCEVQELYPSIEPTSLLKEIQFDLLNFKETQNPKIDSSILILQTGSSRLTEIEALKEEIIGLKVPYHEISVLAPDIEPYVHLIEYVFKDSIPFRIAGIDTSAQSSYKQGLKRLLELERWGAEELLALFETPSFYRKRAWNSETLEIFREWIEKVGIDWGMDAKHRKEILEETLGSLFDPIDHSWEKGLDALLEALVFLKPMQINPDLFEELLSAYFTLKNLDLKGEKTLPDWADAIQRALDVCLSADSEEDKTFQNHIKNIFLEMKRSIDPTPFPIEIVKKFLLTPSHGTLNSSKLHAIRFARLDEGAMIPARVLFLIGMDEMSFPKMPIPSSLDLIKGKIPSQGDFDRYSFLKAIFSAKETLRISYGHLSAEEGKPVGPSLLVQELLSLTGDSILKVYPSIQRIGPSKHLPFPNFSNVIFPEGEIILSIQELKTLARHPWKFFLQNKYKIFPDEEIEQSFALLKGKLIRDLSGNSKIELPGLFKTAMEQDVLEKVNQRKAQLKEWGIEPFTLRLLENTSKFSLDGVNATGPALEFIWEKCRVKLVGEIKMASSKGVVSLGEDNIGGTLKIWPEALAAAALLDAPQICMLRNGKVKTLFDPLQQLKQFIEYYFYCLEAPSPLLPDWADSILRRKDFSSLQSRFADPIAEWVLARAKLPEMDPWAPLLQTTFQGLIDLYPIRGSEKNLKTNDFHAGSS